MIQGRDVQCRFTEHRLHRQCAQWSTDYTVTDVTDTDFTENTGNIQSVFTEALKFSEALKFGALTAPTSVFSGALAHRQLLVDSSCNTATVTFFESKIRL